MNISYSRRASAPYSATTWSGLTTLPRLFDILYARLSMRIFFVCLEHERFALLFDLFGGDFDGIYRLCRNF